MIQKTAWNYNGLVLLLWKSRTLCLQIYGTWIHKEKGQQFWALKTENYHRPGHGVSKELFEKSLNPLGLEVTTYPHNHTEGVEYLTQTTCFPEEIQISNPVR